MVLTRHRIDSCATMPLLDDTTFPAFWSHLALFFPSTAERRNALAQFVLSMLIVLVGLACNHYVTVLL